MRTYTAEDFGYREESMLMHAVTGSIASAKEWASDAHTWFCGNSTEKHIHSCICEEFGELIDVEWDAENKEWKEKLI